MAPEIEAERPQEGDNILPSFKEFEPQTYICARCRQCKYVTEKPIPVDRALANCPSWDKYRFTSHTAGGRINVMWAIAEGRYVPDEAAARLFYECNLCGACTANCSMESEGFDPMRLLEDFRVALVDAGIGPLPEHKPLVDSIKNYDNPWVQPRSRKEAWFKGMDGVRVVRDIDSFEVLFYPGCTYALDPKLQPTLKTIAGLMVAAKSDFAVLGKEEVTCGSTPKRIGVQAMFEDLAKRNIEAFNELAEKKGVKTIVTPCAGC